MPPDSAPHGSSRSLPRLLLIVAAALLAARIGTGVWEREHPPGAPAAHELVDWRPIAAAEAEARAAGRPVLYEFSADWCGPCKRLESEVFEDGESATALNHLAIPVRVVDRAREEGRNPPEVQTLQDRFAVDAFPTLVLFDPRTGRHEAISGYAGRQALLSELEALAKKLEAATP
jgi:thiol:disulfide interchange protein DsbD